MDDIYFYGEKGGGSGASAKTAGRGSGLARRALARAANRSPLRRLRRAVANAARRVGGAIRRRLGR